MEDKDVASTKSIVEPEDISLDIAEILIKLARKSIEYYIEHDQPPEIPSDLKNRYPLLSRKAAVFITIEKIDDMNKRSLRGCIGFILPYYELGKAVVESAVSSAFKDPRFPPLERSEMERITIELSILGSRKKIRDIDSIVLGRDGIYIERGFSSGILLPQVPIEYCWDKETFVAETCIKAGLKPTCWLHNDTEVYRIPGRIFIEIEPNGRVVERDLVKEYMEKCGSIG
jgi:uncharacterized protein (TIGR00296 family)